MPAPCYPSNRNLELYIANLERRRELVQRDERFQRDNNRRATNTDRGPVSD